MQQALLIRPRWGRESLRAFPRVSQARPGVTRIGPFQGRIRPRWGRESLRAFPRVSQARPGVTRIRPFQGRIRPRWGRESLRVFPRVSQVRPGVTRIGPFQGRLKFMKSSTLGYSDWALSGPSVNLLCFTHDVSVFSPSSCIFLIFPIDLLRVGV